MSLLRRPRMRPRDTIDEGPLRIVSNVREDQANNPAGLVYEFRIYRDGKLLTRLCLDHHTDIGVRGTFFLEEDNADEHSTLDQFDEDPGYEVIRERVIAWAREHLLEGNAQ